MCEPMHRLPRVHSSETWMDMMDDCVTSTGWGEDACVCRTVEDEVLPPATAPLREVSDRRRELLLLMHADFALFHGSHDADAAAPAGTAKRS